MTSVFEELVKLTEAEERYLRQKLNEHGIDEAIRCAAENAAKLRIHLDSAIKVIKRMKEEHDSPQT